MQLHITSLPGRPARRRGVRVRRLAGGRRPGVVAGAAARTARPRPLAVQGELGVRRLARAAGEPRAPGVDRARSTSFRERQRVLDRRLGAVRGPRRGRRPGPLRARVGGAAQLRRRARRAPDRRHGDLRRARQRRPPRPPGALPARAPWPGAPPDAVRRPRPAVGQPALRLAGALRASGYRWWVERLRRTLALFDLARIDHFRGFVAYWAVPAGAPDARGGRWRRGPGTRAVRRGLRASSATAAARRRGPRRDHAGRSSGCATSSGCRGCSCSSSASIPTTRAARTARATTPRTGSSTPAPTTTTPRAAGTESLADGVRAPSRRGAAPARDRRARAVVGADPAGALLAGAGRDHPGAGRARPRQRGADEQPRRRATGNWRWRMQPGALTATPPRACAS